ncbi:MAG: LLM class F420-dependent oxidoreductase [Pseudomonadales bacterium]|nr:LLM class F420-dependent oxidoreductase [Pseudomonadales bacterium]
MKLGLMLGVVSDPKKQVELALEAERLGYDSVWFGEIYGSDCFTPLTWIGSQTTRLKLGTSIMQLSARTPANAAMTATTLDLFSEGRLILGIGVSGPQVVEGWYGQPYGKPLARTREWISLFRKMIAREGPVDFEGEYFQLPLDGGTGLGKPLRLITHPYRREIPIYLGAEGPKNVALGAELCQGWVPMFISPYRMEVYEVPLSKADASFEIAATITVSVNDDLEAALAPIKQQVGFYAGGMGAKSYNLHKNHIARLGFADAAEEIQNLFMSGERMRAFEAVPDEFADEISLSGSKDRIRERLQDWEKSPVTSLLVSVQDVETLRFLAEELL